MNHERFKALILELDGDSTATLLAKNAKYAPGDDALHNFHSGGDVFGGTAALACWGYLTKHLVALRDKVQNNDFHDREDLLEKCQDTINYVRFLWCIGNEEMDKYTHGVQAEACEAPVTISPEIPNEAYLRQRDSYEAYLKMVNSQASISCHGHGGNEG